MQRVGVNIVREKLDAAVDEQKWNGAGDET